MVLAKQALLAHIQQRKLLAVVNQCLQGCRIYRLDGDTLHHELLARFVCTPISMVLQVLSARLNAVRRSSFSRANP